MNLTHRFHIRKGDLVQVIAGREKGKQGKVVRVLPKTERVVVEGMNMVKRHVKPNQKYPQGGIISKELPLHISNVMLFDAKAGKPTRVGMKKNDKGQWVRFAKKSGTILDQGK
jgi:large subunit ribosomal protein L24